MVADYLLNGAEQQEPPSDGAYEWVVAWTVSGVVFSNDTRKNFHAFLRSRSLHHFQIPRQAKQHLPQNHDFTQYF